MTPRGRMSWAAWLGLGVALVSLPACQMTNVPLWVAAKPAPTACEVQIVKDIAYYEGPGADERRHRLDLFLPKGRSDFPVVVFLHGGAWLTGDNHCWGLYPAVGEFLASQGIGVAMPNYRLSPHVKHPDHIRDVARAFAWTQQHIGEYGGSADNLFVAGHSAGGHLAALLATDERWLKAEGLGLADVRGAIAVSGVYHIAPGPVNATLGGDSPQALRFDEFFPVRGDSGWRGPLAYLPGIPIHVDLFGRVFGGDDQRQAASPLTYVRPGLPPFMLFGADNDLPTLPAGADEFYQALRAQGCEVEFLRVKDRNHDSIMFGAIQPGDPVADGMVDFIRRHVVQPASRTSNEAPSTKTSLSGS